MRRFVDGTYARGQPIAMMVGMLMEDEAVCLASLRRSLLAKGCRDDLRMLSFADGKYLREPSINFNDTATFDTIHNRPIGQAPSHGTMQLSHMFILMPP